MTEHTIATALCDALKEQGADAGSLPHHTITAWALEIGERLADGET